MLQGIVYCSEQKLQQEISEILYSIPRVSANFLNDMNKVQEFLSEHTVLFILISVNNSENISPLIKLYNRYPQVYFIYYYPALNINNFQQSDFIYFSHIVVGMNREKNLNSILINLTNNYWKKIPYENLGVMFDDLSPRLKKVMNYIETNDLKKCSIAKISDYLNISQGYFSQEFKRETTLTFRDFMQNLLAHYEQIIFERLDLSAKTASQILGYSELSSFSRSFKKRKGYPPSHQKTHKYAEVSK